MKKLFYTVFLSLSFCGVMKAQKVDKKILDNIILIQTSHTSQEFSNLRDEFVLMGNDNKYGWLPGYYAAVSTLHEGNVQLQQKSTNEALGSALTAEKYLSKITDNNNSEVMILKGLIYSLQIKADASRYEKNVMLINDIINKAEKSDSNNPRLALLKVELLTLNPENAVRKLHLYQEIAEKFNSLSPANSATPTWGKNLATLLGKEY